MARFLPSMRYLLRPASKTHCTILILIPLLSLLHTAVGIGSNSGELLWSASTASTFPEVQTMSSLSPARHLVPFNPRPYCDLQLASPLQHSTLTQYSEFILGSEVLLEFAIDDRSRPLDLYSPPPILSELMHQHFLTSLLCKRTWITSLKFLLAQGFPTSSFRFHGHSSPICV